MTIFLIEDDTIYAEFIGRSLAVSAPYEISAFTNAEEALVAIEKK